MRAQGLQHRYPESGPAVDDRVHLWIRDAHAGTRLDDWDPDVLFGDLELLRRAMSPSYWRNRVVPWLRSLPLYRRALECPFSQHATRKPRGYAGDAALLDYVYGPPEEVGLRPGVTERGARLCTFWMNTPGAEALRARTAWLGGVLDEVAGALPEPRVLVLGCGHGPELDHSEAAGADGFGSLVAIDRDVLTLSTLVGNRSCRIVPVRTSIGSMLRAPEPYDVFDLVYAVGLLDHLPDRIAQRLLATLVDQVRPGGRLIVDNFLPTNPGIAALELFQDWWLRYRDRRQLEAMIGGALGERQAESTFLADPDDCLGILDLTVA